MIQELMIYTAFIGLTIAVFFDLEKRVIPNWLNLSLFLVGVFGHVSAFILTSNIVFLIISGIWMGIFFIGGLFLANHKALGWGDIKLLIALSALLGTYFEGLFLLHFMFMFAIISIITIIVVKFKYKKKIPKNLPFAPIIYLAFITTFLYISLL